MTTLELIVSKTKNRDHINSDIIHLQIFIFITMLTKTRFVFWKTKEIYCIRFFNVQPILQQFRKFTTEKNIRITMVLLSPYQAGPLTAE